MALIGIPLVLLFPAATVLIRGAIGDVPPPRWLAVPVVIAWAAFLVVRCTRAAVRRLESRGLETFARVRVSA